MVSADDKIHRTIYIPAGIFGSSLIIATTIFRTGSNLIGSKAGIRKLHILNTVRMITCRFLLLADFNLTYINR